MNLFSRRAAGTFLAICIAASVAADSYHPHIAKSRVVSLDVRTIESHANSGKPFELNLGETRLEVVLSPAPVSPKEGLTVIEIAEDGSMKKRIVQSNITYAGEVVGEDPEESEARFTIDGDVLDGYVSSTTGWWFLEPLARFDPKAGPAQYLVYATHELDFAVEYGHDGVKIDEVKDWTETPTGPQRLVIPVVMVADREYIGNDSTLNFIARQQALIHNINGIYRHQIGRTFEIVTVVADFSNRVLTSSNAGTLKTQLQCVVDSAGTGGAPCQPGIGGLMNLNGFIAHLTTAKNLTGSSDWTYGIADQNGRYGLSQQGRPVGLTAQNTMIAAHEIGHNFGGLHCAADYQCRNGVCGYTIMRGTYSSASKPWFSDALHLPQTPCPPNGLNNRKNIRDFMTEVQFF
jgi:hypothetical protein